MEEIWKDIRGIDSKHEISNKGRVRNKKTGKILSPKNSKGWYLSVQLLVNGKYKTFRIHRLVAQYFVPNPNKLPIVNHKDLNKQNNFAENLEWVTYKENTQHAIENEAYNNAIKTLVDWNKNKKCFKKYGYIYQFDKEMNFIAKYISATEASKKTGVCSTNILQCINHKPKRKSAGGYIWLKEKEVVEQWIMR